MARSDPLAGARVPREKFEVLEAAAYVRRLSIQALLAPEIERFADVLSREPAVKTALEARRESDSRDASKVREIAPHSSTQRGRD